MAQFAALSRLTRPVHRAGEVFSRVLSRLAGAARFVVITLGVHNKALQISALCLVSSASLAATTPGTTIINTVLANYQVSSIAYSSTAVLTVDTDSSVRFLAVSATGTPTALGATQCASSGASSGPFDLISTVAAASVTLAPATQYSNGQGVYVEVTDLTKNLNPVALDTVVVTVTSGGTASDSETLQLTETGPNTGVFVGAVSSTLGTAAINNCALSVATHSSISAAYQRGPTTSVSAASVLVDPYGIVFNSSNGLPVDGATVTLINASNGQLATVFCDDAISVSPNPMVTGSTFTACGSTQSMLPGSYRFPLIAPGNYALQVVPPQGYTFASTVPPASLLPGYAVLGMPGAGASYGTSFAVDPGPALQVDIPIDPPAGTLHIAKRAEKSVAAVGEYVPYTLTIQNNDTSNPALSVQIVDRLPLGFRYQTGSARMDNTPLADPAIAADGRTLTFSLGNVAASGAVSLTYVALVTAGAQSGKAENTAAAISHVSNTARASITVQEDLMLDRAILMGRVTTESCDEKESSAATGIANARIVLEDGTTILTDSEGRWHADHIRPGTHVVQLDLDSLPKDYEAVVCEDNTRFAGRSYSQFVNVRGGSLWRADFHVRKKTVEETRLIQSLTTQRLGSQLHVKLELRGGMDVYQASSTLMLPDGATLVKESVKLDQAASNALESGEGVLILRLGQQHGLWAHTLELELNIEQADAPKLAAFTRFLPAAAGQGINLPKAEIALTEGRGTAESSAPIPNLKLDSTRIPPGNMDRNQLVEHLPYDAGWLLTANPGTEWLHPQETFLPAIPVIKAAVKLMPGHKATLILNGEEVSPLYFDGTETNIPHTVALATWRGIHINEGDNRMELIVRDASGSEVLRQQRNIHYSSAPDRVELVPEYSRLIADGKTRPVIAVRLLDRDGYRVRRGISGEFQLNSPYQSAFLAEAIERDSLGGKPDGKPRYQVGAEGIALIELLPTTQSGNVVLNFKFDEQRTHEASAWLQAAQRDWVLVGFAEGTSGHQKLSGNMTGLQEFGTDTQLFDGNRAALYAKGSIKGEVLLTLAYDSAKQQRDGFSQAIDPTRYYTLYADNAQPAFDAASSSKLYLKIERKQFYALFGDFDTGLTVTEFSRYSRSVNGLKSQFEGEHVGYNVFTTKTAQAYVRDEIPGDGTSGLYRLTRGNIMENSDKIRIEARDRFQSQVVVTSQILSRHIDYDIDTVNGTLFFKQPVMVRDENFNPVYIVAEYESHDTGDENVTAGGRISIKPSDRVEIGTSLIHDGTEGASGNLGGLDTTWNISDKTRINAEWARSMRDLTLLGIRPEGHAWKAEVAHHGSDLDAKAYVREQEDAFGLGQQAASESSTRKTGVEARLRVSDKVQLQGQAYRQDVISTVIAQRNVADARINYHFGNRTSYLGGRHATDDDGLGTDRTSNQVLAGVGTSLFNQTIGLHADTEISIGNPENGDYPDRLRLGADYKLTAQSKLFAEQEFARSADDASNMTRAGLRTKPWSGGEMTASLANQSAQDSGRTYANLGLVQRWQVSPAWQMDAALDRAKILRSSGTAPLNFSTPPASGSNSGDYTAASLGTNYNGSIWGMNNRIERRLSSTERRLNFLAGIQRTLSYGRSVSAGFNYTTSLSALSRSNRYATRLSYAHRPLDSTWIWLDRLDYIDEKTTPSAMSTADTIHTSKLVNNFNGNWMPRRGTQVALQYGAKYVLDRIARSSYSGYTDLIGLELRQDLTRRWDVGVHLHQLNSRSAHAKSYSLGASLGCKIVDNAWIAAGYNVAGFKDGDFSGADTRARGFYIALRIKFDQDTLKFNDNKPLHEQP